MRLRGDCSPLLAQDLEQNPGRGRAVGARLSCPMAWQCYGLPRLCISGQAMLWPGRAMFPSPRPPGIPLSIGSRECDEQPPGRPAGRPDPGQSDHWRSNGGRIAAIAGQTCPDGPEGRLLGLRESQGPKTVEKRSNNGQLVVKFDRLTMVSERRVGRKVVKAGRDPSHYPGRPCQRRKPSVAVHPCTRRARKTPLPAPAHTHTHTHTHQTQRPGNVSGTKADFG